MKKKENSYTIEVVFSTPVTVTVLAEDVDEAMDTAEWEATKVFQEMIDSGMLGIADFECEAQTP